MGPVLPVHQSSVDITLGLSHDPVITGPPLTLCWLRLWDTRVAEERPCVHSSKPAEGSVTLRRVDSAWWSAWRL